MLDTIANSLKYALDRLVPNRNDPQVRRRALCHQLRDLHSSLRRVIETGRAIGDNHHFSAWHEAETRRDIERLAELLTQQNQNIKDVSNHIAALESILRIKLPATTESLCFYVPIKGNVITILSAAADEQRYQEEDPIWHRSWWFKTERIDAVIEALTKSTLTGPERMRGEMFLEFSSEVFTAIEKATEELRVHIDKACAAEDLI